ncbi:hypothetical protein [Pseudonocardia sp. H11422]|uniref:hypothetical protein n=1 Tax=Pseudonocardia sp. H11422 TaxID=2835866 RepID=UPI001BDD1826|nr:hypothetical protein [Pseudonocardia sp. H11422]
MTQPWNPQQPTQQWLQPHNIQIPTQRQGEPPTGGPPPAPKPKRKKWPWIAGGTVLLLAIIIGTANSGSGSSSAPTAASPTTPFSSAFRAPAVAAPTTTAPTTTAPKPTSPPTVYEGRGDDVVTITKDPGVAVLQFECPKCSSNTVLKTDGAENLLVNEIGAYKGKHLIDISDTSITSTLTINASGAWKVTVASGLGMATTATGNNPVSGTGDDVVLMLGTATKARITNKGESNFVVKVYPASGYPDLAVNEIGSYQGTVPLDAPAVVQVTSSGKWTIAPS